MELFLLIFFLEFLNTTSCVKEHLLSCKERMRCRANFHFDNRIVFAIGPFNGLLCVEGRAAYELEIARSIPKNHVPVFRMNAFFHCSFT